MTKPATATRAQIKRAISAAIAAGLRVKGIAADGTVLIDDGSAPILECPTVKRKYADD